MTDRSSYSYRANTPSSNPDMYQKGGQLKQAFKEERCSPYIAKHSKTQSDTKTTDKASSKEAFMSQRKRPSKPHQHSLTR